MKVPYYFQLENDGECSNILKVSITEGDLHYDLIEGDRDGGDRGEQQPPTVTLPPDQPDQYASFQEPPDQRKTLPQNATGRAFPHQISRNTADRPGECQPYRFLLRYIRQNVPGTAPFRISSAAQEYQEALTSSASLSPLPGIRAFR